MHPSMKVVIFYTDSPDDPQLRTLLAQLVQVMKKPSFLRPTHQLKKKRQANVLPVLPTLAFILPN